MYRIIVCGLAAWLVLAGWAAARPVSYPDGWTAMQMNDADSHSLHVHYSPTVHYSIGLKSEYWRDEKWWFNGVQMNNLLKRWNGAGSQANLYVKSAIGIAHSDYRAFDNKNELAGFTGLAADWETRRYFISYENRWMYAGDIDRSFQQKARMGIAPYIGNYGDLHTWFMLQVDHQPDKRDPVTFTPLVRFFKGVHLLEAGISDKRDVLFNYIVRF